MREKVGKSRNTVFFQWFGAPEGRKVGLLKRRVRSQLARWEMKNCTPLWREAHFQVKMYKTHQVRTTFGSWDVEKVHAVEARSTFPSQNAQNTPGADHFWQLRCRKSARRCKTAANTPRTTAWNIKASNKWDRGAGGWREKMEKIGIGKWDPETQLRCCHKAMGVERFPKIQCFLQVQWTYFRLAKNVAGRFNQLPQTII